MKQEGRMRNCGYLNKDDTCNTTILCEEKNCAAIKSNYSNVRRKAEWYLRQGKMILQEINELEEQLNKELP